MATFTHHVAGTVHIHKAAKRGHYNIGVDVEDESGKPRRTMCGEVYSVPGLAKGEPRWKGRYMDALPSEGGELVALDGVYHRQSAAEAVVDAFIDALTGGVEVDDGEDSDGWDDDDTDDGWGEPEPVKAPARNERAAAVARDLDTPPVPTTGGWSPNPLTPRGGLHTGDSDVVLIWA